MKIVIGNNISQLVIGGPDYLVDPSLGDSIRDYMSIDVPGAFHSPQFKRRVWDGKKYFCTPRFKVPTGMLPVLLGYLEDVYEDLNVELVDERNNIVTFPKEWDTQVGDYSMGGDYEHQLRLAMAYDHSVKYRDQELYFPRGVVDAATNAGKTTILAGIFRNAICDNKSMLILIHRKAIYTQLVDFMGNVFGDVGQINDKHYFIKDVTVAMIQTLTNRVADGVVARQDIKKFPIIAVDECFEGATLISGIKIKDCKIGDYTLSYNHDKHAVEYKRINHIFKKPVSQIAKVTFSDGRYIICTKDHPFFSTTYGDYVEISKLMNTFVLNIEEELYYGKKSKVEPFTMSRMWGSCGTCNDNTEETTQQGENVLFRGVQKESTIPRDQRSGVFSRLQPGVCIRKDEEKQPNERSENQGESQHYITCYESQAKDTGRKWPWSNRTSAIISTCFRLGYGDSYINKGAKKFWIPNLLQNRYWKRIIKNSYRGRWQISSRHQKARTRQKENNVFGELRVESIKIYKQGSDNEFRRLCPEGVVYNLEVEDNNNYFAEGVLVHNCHRAASKQYKTVLKHSDAYCRIFVSGSALDSNDPVAKLDIISLSGPKLAEIKKVELMQKGISTPVEVRVHLCSTLLFKEPDMYDEYIDELVKYSSERVSIIGKLVRAASGPTIIAVDKIEHGQFIFEGLPKCNAQ